MNNKELTRDIIKTAKHLDECLDKIRKSKATLDFSDEAIILLDKIFTYIDKFEELRSEA